jgi:medium-chain acyl-[acyl-carrier-protein] hydrolase
MCPHPNPQAQVRLFCLPYAGGGAWSFRPWANELPVTIEVCAVELPGRGARMQEPPFTRLEDLLRSLLPVLMPYLDKPFALFGHSMGGLISFELARWLRRDYQLSPTHLFISGRRAPQIPNRDRPIHALPEDQLLEKLGELNGTPDHILQNRELMQLVLPTLRADFAVIETYSYFPEAPLTCPITVFGGLQDPTITPDELEVWHEHTSHRFALHLLPGNHFFLHPAQAQLLTLISSRASLNPC